MHSLVSCVAVCCKSNKMVTPQIATEKAPCDMSALSAQSANLQVASPLNSARPWEQPIIPLLESISMHVAQSDFRDRSTAISCIAPAVLRLNKPFLDVPVFKKQQDVKADCRACLPAGRSDTSKSSIIPRTAHRAAAGSEESSLRRHP